MHRYILILLMAVLPWGMKALGEEPLRPVRSAYMLEGGSSHLLDTYLSPLKYTGWHTAFSYERVQAMKFSPEKWRQQLDLGIEVNNADNPARNASLLYGNLSAGWSMSRLWRLPYRLTLTVGGRGEGNLGAIYCNRNSNNPVALKADLNIGAVASIGWDVKLWRLPVGLRWQTSMPLLGVFFAPEYDELYYEIYLGNSPRCSRWSLRPRQQTAALSRKRATAPTSLSRPIPYPFPFPPMTLGKAPCRSPWKSCVQSWSWS